MATRRSEYLDRIALHLEGSEETPDGFIYSFRLADGVITDLATIIELERACCPFLDFKLSIGAGAESAKLEMAGAEGTKEAIRELFNWN